MPDHKVTYGPNRGHGTGMCWSIQSHLETIEGTINEEDVLMESEFRGHNLVL